MFIVVGRNGDNFSIKDTTDGVVETYSYEKVVKILKMGIKIQGLDIKKNRLLYKSPESIKADITKKAILLGYEIIRFTKNDTKNTIRHKVNSLKENCSIIVFNESSITDMSDMFSGCKASRIDLSNFDTSNVKDMSFMFNDCRKLVSLDLGNFDTSKVTNMCCMFRNCSSLTELDLSSFNTSKVTNMTEMFERCSSLISLDVSNFDTSNVKNIDFMFYNCSAKLILPKTGKLASYGG